MNVQFFPDPDQGNSWPISSAGLTDEEGRYVLTYRWRLGEGDGAPVGWHRVTLDDTILGGIPQGKPLPQKRVPEVFSIPSRSPLSFEVRAGAQTINIEVP